MNVTLIEDGPALDALSKRVVAAERVALDTEFHNERSYAPRLMVVQLVIDDDVALVDALRIEDLSALTQALTSVTVVGHALQGDLKIFADRFQRLPRFAFDTQLAAAFCGFGPAVSLADLVHDVVGTRLRKAHTVSDWSARPLSPRQIEYLVDDVRHLFTLQDRLTERLTASRRYEWFVADAQALVDVARYRWDPERLYLRIPGALRMSRRELAILRELAELRDRIARERDVPLRYILPDDVMTSLVALRPSRVEDLTQLRRLEPGARKAFGERIVAAVAAGTAVPEDRLPKKPARQAGPPREAVVSCLMVLANAIAAENGVPAPLLTSRSALERVAREANPTPAGVARALDTSEWRERLLAEPLCALLSGEIALTIDASDATPRVARVALNDVTGGYRSA